MSWSERFIRVAILILSSSALTCCSDTDRGEAQSGCQTILASLFDSEDFELQDSISVYSPENLYDYLDGGAEFYLEHGFRRLATALVVSKATAAQITVEIFRMKNPSGAGLIYAAERGEMPDNLEAGDRGFKSGSFAEFLKGEFLVKLMGLGTAQAETEEMAALARLLAAAIQS